MSRYKIEDFELSIRGTSLESVSGPHDATLEDAHEAQMMKEMIWGSKLWTDGHPEEPSTKVYFTRVHGAWALIDDFNSLMWALKSPKQEGLFYMVNIEDDLL